MEISVSNIVWDTEVDGVVHDVDLPSEMLVNVDLPPDASFEEISEQALDACSDKTGWCILSSSVQPIN